MSEKFGGFWTTGIWVFLRYAIPICAFIGAVMVFSPSSRVQVATALHSSLGQVVDLSHVPGLENGIPAATAIPGLGAQTPEPPAGGFWFRNFGIGKPVVDDTTLRVRLSDLPSSGKPQVVKISDLPSPIEPNAYKVGRSKPLRAPAVMVSLRPHSVPADVGSLPPFASAQPGFGDQIVGLMSRFGIPVAP